MSGEWIVKRDLDLADNLRIQDDLRYVIDSIIEIVLRKQSSQSLERYRTTGPLRAILVRPGAPLYAKASTSSEVNANVPENVEFLYVMDGVQGLDSNEWYWSAYHIKKGGPFLSGFLSANDAQGELFEGPNPLHGSS